jgi:PD-(D/E)XK nuclease superfamily
MTENAIAKEIVDAAFRIHTTLGPGLLESVYHTVLAYELAQRGLQSVEALAPVHKKQLLTYLRLADKRLGLLINFNAALIKDGISRIVNGLEDESHAKSQGRQEHP